MTAALFLALASSLAYGAADFLGGAAARGAHVLRALAREALERAAQGRLRPTVGQTFALEEAAAAHATIEARAALGKTLLVTR
jgi:NADPH:quinone reductase